jgi:fumarate reductase flavoprotein subunit
VCRGPARSRCAGPGNNPQDHAEDAARFADPAIEARNESDLRAYFLQQAGESLEWLRTLGLSFVGPSPEPPNRCPRMHNVVPGAKAYIAALQMALLEAGGTLQCDATVVSLERDGDRIAGVQAEIQGQTRTIRARRGVVLAAGDYAGNAQLIARFKGDGFAQIEGINPFACGDGHRLAEEAGAQLLNMDITYGPELRFVPSHKRPFQQWLPASGPAAKAMATLARWMPPFVMRALIKRLLVTWQHPENQLFADGAVLVNRAGRRFVDERQWPAREVAVANQPDKVAFILLDGRLAQRYSAWPHFISTAPDIAYAYVRDYQRLRPDVTATGESLEAIAAQRGLDASALNGTVGEFNAYVRGERPDEWGRSGDREPLGQPPWVLLGPVKAYFTTTEGGAAINRRMQVLDEMHRPIPGLYAVGQNGLGGMILWSHGLHIAWAITSGRLAGEALMTSEELNKR